MSLKNGLELLGSKVLRDWEPDKDCNTSVFKTKDQNNLPKIEKRWSVYLRIPFCHILKEIVWCNVCISVSFVSFSVLWEINYNESFLA